MQQVIKLGVHHLEQPRRLRPNQDWQRLSSAAAAVVLDFASSQPLPLRATDFLFQDLDDFASRGHKHGVVVVVVLV